MKILLNSYNFSLNGKRLSYGGTRNFTKNFLDHLSTTPHKAAALVIAGKKQNNSQFTLNKRKTKWGEEYRLTLRLNTKDVFEATRPVIPTSLKVPVEIIKSTISKINPDVVLISGSSIANWMILKAASELKIPTVVSHHGLWFKEVLDAPRKITKSAVKIIAEMEKDNSRLADKEIFLNKFSLTKYEIHLTKTNPRKVEIIPIPYNPIFAKLEKPKRNKFLKIGFVGRWDPIKNIESVLGLAKKIKQLRLPWQMFSVIKIYPYYVSLRKYRKPFTDNITVSEQMNPDQLRRFYAKMDILILPSRFDVSPTVVLEALLQKKWTIISPQVGWVDLYRKFGQSQFVDNFKNTSKLVAKIKNLSHLKVPAILYNKLKNDHNPKTVYKKYLRLLASLIK